MLKKFWLKLTDKQKYDHYKLDLNIQKKLNILKSGLEKKLNDISHNIENKKNISFFHSGHLGDIIYSLPILKELSKTHECNLYIEKNKHLNSRYHNHPGGDVFLNEKLINMLLPLLKNQPYISSTKIHTNEKIDVDLNLFRKMPMNVLFQSTGWYSHVTGVHPDLSSPYLSVKTNERFKNKVVIIRSIRRRNYFVKYDFIKNYNNLLFIGLNEEYNDLKKSIPNLEFYDCKDFLEMAEIIKSGKFFLGNLSFGFAIAEGLKIPRLLEASPDFHALHHNGENAYDFYFQNHFEKLFDKLYKK